MTLVLPTFFGTIPVHGVHIENTDVTTLAVCETSAIMTPLVVQTVATPSNINIDSDTVAPSLEKIPRRSNSSEMRSVSSSHIPEPLSCISGTASTAVVVDIESLDTKVNTIHLLLTIDVFTSNLLYVY